jgi:hypothetical protein
LGEKKPQSRTIVRLGAQDKRGICTREYSAYQGYRIQEEGMGVNALSAREVESMKKGKLHLVDLTLKFITSEQYAMFLCESLLD